MSWWKKRVTIGENIELCPVILRARAILAIPDTSKRKSEWRVIDPGNKILLTNPEIEPRLFLECKVAGVYWGSGPKTFVIDVENHKIYKNVTGTSYKKGSTVDNRSYLKAIKDGDIYSVKPKDITNLEDVLKLVLGGEKKEE